MKKRGATHIEMILSSVIFISFVLFLLVFLRPGQSENLTDSIVLKIKGSFEDENLVSRQRVFVKALDAGCVNVDIIDNETIQGSIVKTFPPSGLSPTSSSIVDGIVIFNNTIGNQSFEVFVSEEFPNGNSDCNQERKKHVSGNIATEEFLSNSSLTAFRQKYISDYTQLKRDLEIPKSVDFAIVSENFVLQKNIPENIQVIAKTYNYEILYNNGDVKHDQFTIKIW